MELPHYEILPEENLHTFRFISEGKKKKYKREFSTKKQVPMKFLT